MVGNHNRVTLCRDFCLREEGSSLILPKILICKFGRVNDEIVNQIVSVMQECYVQLAPHEVEVLDLYVFERSTAVEAFLAEESRRIGVASSSFDEVFFSMHDAWRGIPRIIICLEGVKKLMTLAQQGGIRHEVGHSVLHGSPRYYIFAIPPALQDLGKRYKLSRQHITNVLYLISIAVKDYEISRLLQRHGYVKDQMALAKHMLSPTESDRTIWEISKAKPDAEALCLTSYLKLIGYTTPFLVSKNSRKEINHYLKGSLSYLPKRHSTKLLREIPKLFQQLELDTLNNINKFTNLIVQEMIQPIYEDKWGYLIS